MTGWLVNDRLTAIPGTRTFWHHLLGSIPGLIDKTVYPYSVLADFIEAETKMGSPDYVIRNAAYFRALSVDCPVISFVQDIVSGAVRDMLIEAATASRIVVFNSEYTRMMYPELHAADYRVIPIGTDETVFKPCEKDPDIPEHSVLWIGSSHYVKGFDLACQLADSSQRPWVFVMKDDSPVPVDGCIVYRSISQARLASIASSCAVGVCTSREETQHLAGIEAGMCGLPLVTTNVGIYYGRVQGSWGTRTNGNWSRDIELVSRLPREGVSAYWNVCGLGLSSCLSSWTETIRSLEAAYVHG
jgi:glycosyltransferase involved in cell wall biosynthesis